MNVSLSPWSPTDAESLAAAVRESPELALQLGGEALQAPAAAREYIERHLTADDDGTVAFAIRVERRRRGARRAQSRGAPARLGVGVVLGDGQPTGSGAGVAGARHGRRARVRDARASSGSSSGTASTTRRRATSPRLPVSGPRGSSGPSCATAATGSTSRRTPGSPPTPRRPSCWSPCCGTPFRCADPCGMLVPWCGSRTRSDVSSWSAGASPACSPRPRWPATDVRSSCWSATALPDGPVPRKGVPQGRQPHVFLHRGLLAVEELLPGTDADLRAAGAVPLDTGHLAWLGESGWAPRAPQYGILSMTRPLFEHVVRHRVAELPGVAVRDGTAVTGLRRGPSAGPRWLVDTQDAEVPADLVVDASGRSSRLPHWLETLGVDRARISEVDAHVGYATAQVAGTDARGRRRRGRPAADAGPAGRPRPSRGGRGLAGHRRRGGRRDVRVASARRSSAPSTPCPTRRSRTSPPGPTGRSRSTGRPATCATGTSACAGGPTGCSSSATPCARSTRSTARA